MTSKIAPDGRQVSVASTAGGFVLKVDDNVLHGLDFVQAVNELHYALRISRTDAAAIVEAAR